MALMLLTACSADEVPAAPPPDVPTAEVEEAPIVDQQVQSTVEIKGPRASARHVLIAYKDAYQASEKVSRTKEEARALATTVQSDILGGADFSSQAIEHSDGPSGKRGGELGVFGKGTMHINFEQAVLDLDVGELSKVVETPFGFHVIERMVVEEVRVAQVLIQWQGCHRATTDRTKEDAQLRAEAALQALHAGTNFIEVGKRYSDGPTGQRGGDLGWFQRGQMVPAFEEASFSLEPGKITDVIESPLGFHIILRLN